ncbi:helix-turn-helix transcriptional regulator (plasmid) [Streptomyces sp. CWNU-52B]|uniref:helix-turn-helix transcriptional regulator n=1 Tax=unclassified Streptomyces TaxID=2593676 RepID=UPI0039C0CA6B
MDEGTKKLGSLLQVARQAHRPKLTQPEAAKAIGVSRGTIQKIEAGDFAEVSKNVRKYATYLGFSDGEADQIARGEHAAAGGHSAESEHLPLPPAVEYELRASTTLEAGVIPLGPDEDDGHIIVILQGRKGATPEELERIAARYRKPRRMLQGLAGESDEVADS